MLKLWQKTTALAPDGEPFQIISLQNASGMRVQFMDWGATWLSCQVPVGKAGEQELREVLLGCQPQDYPVQNAYMGASIGRYANRIAQAKYADHSGEYVLQANQGEHQLHGGAQGFDKVRWKIEDFGADFVCFYHFSADGDQGFPGNVAAFVTYKLAEDNSLTIHFEAENGADTPLNLTNHAYFNLNQHADARAHILQINADYFLPVDSQGIPNAPLKAVAGTSFDFRQAKPIARDFLQQEQLLTKGYDHSFLLDKQQKNAAILTAVDGALSLEISTSQPAIQLYTGNYLQGNPTREGKQYADYSGVALETQALPDTPNHPEWWQYGGMTKAGEGYDHWTKFHFVVAG